MKKGSFPSFLKKYSFSGVLCRRLESSLSIKSYCATLNATTPRLRFGYFSIEAFFDGLPVECSDVERISWLVAHHHTYTNIDGPDHQILLEADFLVNAGESSYHAQQSKISVSAYSVLPQVRSSWIVCI